MTEERYRKLAVLLHADVEEGWRRLVKAREMDPQYNPFAWESEAEVLFQLCDYEAALEIYRNLQNPPLHAYTHMAACYAHLGRMEEAHKAAAQFRSLCSEDVDFPRYASNHARICKRQEDTDNWIEGYRKAGLLD